MSSRRFYLACATIATVAIGAIAWAEYAEAIALFPSSVPAVPTNSFWLPVELPTMEDGTCFQTCSFIDC